MTKYTQNIIKIVLTSLVFFLLSSCSTQHSEDLVDIGEMKSGIYKNKFLGVSIDKPIKWYIRVRINRASNSGHKKYNVGKLFLFAWFQRPANARSNVGFNSNVLGVLERILVSSGIKTAKQYLLSIKSLMKKSAVNYDFSSSIKLVKLGGKDFQMIEVAALIAGQNIKVRYYTNINNSYAFSIIVSWQTKEQFKAIERMLASVIFNK